MVENEIQKKSFTIGNQVFSINLVKDKNVPKKAPWREAAWLGSYKTPALKQHQRTMKGWI